MVTLAKQTDLKQLMNIWKVVFGDSDQLIEEYYHHVFSPDDTLVYRVEEEPVAILHMIPDTDNKRVYYYALATLPEHRGRGYMTDMMEYGAKLAEERGFGEIFLIPAGESLFAYYRLHGFVHSLTLTRHELQQDLGPLRLEVMEPGLMRRMVQKSWDLTDETLINGEKVKNFVLFEEENEKNVEFYDILYTDKSYGYAIINQDESQKTILHFGISKEIAPFWKPFSGTGVEGLSRPLNQENRTQELNGFIPF